MSAISPPFKFPEIEIFFVGCAGKVKLSGSVIELKSLTLLFGVKSVVVSIEVSIIHSPFSLFKLLAFKTCRGSPF